MGILVKTASDKSRRVSTRTLIDISSLVFVLLSGSVPSPLLLALSMTSFAFQSIPETTPLRVGTTEPIMTVYFVTR